MTNAKNILLGSQSQTEVSALDQIKSRKLKQVFLGITGPLGSGTTMSANIMQKNLVDRGFSVHIIKVSKLIEAVESVKIMKYVIPAEYSAERIHRLQDKGNELREKINKHVTAKLICAEIKNIRDSLFGPDHESEFEKQDKPVAFIIDSIKNHREIEFLKEIYQDSFFLFGLVTKEEICKVRLRQKGIEPSEISKLIANEVNYKSEDSGQNVIKCLEQADFFVRNDIPQKSLLEEKIIRCLNLIFSSKVITPSKHESGMYHAYVAAARSACLSRQVGAAIVAADGEILATGCNDVPKAFGGLYNQEDKHDQRCYLKGGKCFNDYHKNRMLKKVQIELKKNNIQVMTTKPGIDASKALEDAIFAAGLKDLIEFSRAVHAEMDAIIQLARKSSESTVGTSMYTTTFPCHSCARHIVAAGIKEVYYVEPYKKSLATDLHDDSISQDGVDPDKICFVPYEGVSPRRYLSLFKKQSWKDEKGTLKIPARAILSEGDALNFDKFYEIESKAISKLHEYLQ